MQQASISLVSRSSVWTATAAQYLESALAAVGISDLTVANTYVAPPQGQALAGPLRSWLLEEFLNYFPDTDLRVRNLRYSLDAQLLNPMALAMEDHARRFDREVRSRSFNAPLNIDNRGVYFKCLIPASYPLGITADGVLAAPQKVRGRLPGGAQYVQLRPYDDVLPVPSRLELDTSLAPVRYTTPLLFTVTGNDFPQTLTASAVPFPNPIFLVLSNLPASAGLVEVRVTGAVWPTSQDGQQTSSVEVVRLRDEGVAVTQNAYSSIDSIAVRGLPAGAVLTGYGFLFSGAAPDPDRPAIDSDWRGDRFPRYWQIDGQLLKDTYTRGRFSGFQVSETYLCDTPLATLAVEPNTAGLWTAAGTMLYYADRRQVQPLRLEKTGLVKEPFYGLNVRYDETRPGPVRYVQLTPTAYARAASAAQYRYSVVTPDNVTWLLNADGALTPFNAYGGWRPGSPPSLSLALAAAGTYLFTLETGDQSRNITRDTCPYRHSAFAPLAQFDLSSLTPAIKGIGFDSLERMWIWSGSFLIPILLHYDSFSFDPATRALYLTDKYDEVQLLN